MIEIGRITEAMGKMVETSAAMVRVKVAQLEHGLGGTRPVFEGIKDKRLSRAVELALEESRLQGRAEVLQHLIYGKPLPETEHTKSAIEVGVNTERITI